MPSLAGHIERTQQAERAGFASVWVRDVPMLDPSFEDAGQVFDPWEAAASVDQLSGGRLPLGVATGDRPVEFPAFGQDLGDRAEKFRQALEYFRVVLEHRFPHVESPLGRMRGTDLLPKPVYRRIPVLMTGRARQDVRWIADNTDGDDVGLAGHRHRSTDDQLQAQPPSGRRSDRRTGRTRAAALPTRALWGAERAPAARGADRALKKEDPGAPA
ncbi:LLM class flavin-dependent oxidoreductase [Streptomyces sp. NPDC003719]